jgi:hypothetical protein
MWRRGSIEGGYRPITTVMARIDNKPSRSALREHGPGDPQDPGARVVVILRPVGIRFGRVTTGGRAPSLKRVMQIAVDGRCCVLRIGRIPGEDAA